MLLSCEGKFQILSCYRCKLLPLTDRITCKLGIRGNIEKHTFIFVPTKDIFKEILSFPHSKRFKTSLALILYRTKQIL